jgi:hypothetical protein
MQSVSQIDRRRIEAEMALRIYAELMPVMGEDRAMEIIKAAACADAREQGARLAKGACGEPGLAHFATVMDVWRAGGALEFADVRLTDTVWSFTVTRCAYAEIYRDMGLPKKLAQVLSCARDAHLAAGYSPRLKLTRPETIVGGYPACGFTFTWT